MNKKLKSDSVKKQAGDIHLKLLMEQQRALRDMMALLRDTMHVVLNELPYTFTPDQETRFRGILERLEGVMDKDFALQIRQETGSAPYSR